LVRLLRRLLRGLPLERSLALAAAGGRVFARASKGRAVVARTNLRLAFPDWSEAEREQVRAAALANLGRLVAETARLPDLTLQEVKERIRIEGLEHLEAARRASPTGGALVLTGHFGSWELCAAAMALHGLPLSIVHRMNENAFADRLVREWREHAGIEVLARGSAAREAIDALRRGRLLVVPLDQNAKRHEGIFVPFFGVPACTRDAPARLAMRLGVPVVPAAMYRIGGSGRHVLRIWPALALAPGGSDRAAAVRENVLRMNRALEEMIRQGPELWIWNHRRFRTRPEGEARLYPSKRRRGSVPAAIPHASSLSRKKVEN
jgi:KDO2-lipid IV(A) lauroyltransferase